MDPAQLDRVRDHIVVQACSLRDLWHFYRNAFVSDTREELEKRNELLGQAGNGVFLLMRSLESAIVLAIARLLDPASTKGKSNVSVEYYFDQMPRETPHLSKWKEKLNKLRQDARPIVVRRNASVAHSAASAVLHNQGLVGVSPDNVGCVVNSLLCLVSTACATDDTLPVSAPGNNATPAWFLTALWISREVDKLFDMAGTIAPEDLQARLNVLHDAIYRTGVDEIPIQQTWDPVRDCP